MSQLRERILKAGYTGYCGKEQGDWSLAYLAAAGEALRIAQERFGKPFFNKREHDEIDRMLAEIGGETPHHEQKDQIQDHGAGLIHQVASPLAETEPRLITVDEEKFNARIDSSLEHYAATVAKRALRHAQVGCASEPPRPDHG